VSDTFDKIQNGLRALKDHGIDLTVPHGTSLAGRVYPSVNKAIVFGNNWEYEGASFSIPLENHHRVQVTHTFNAVKKPYIRTNVYYPTQTGEWYLDDIRKWGVVNHIAPYERTIHDRLKEYSLEKSRGIRVFNRGQTIENVPDDELQEHYKIGEAAKQKRIKEDPRQAVHEKALIPHFVKVHKTFPAESSKLWLYDVKTERLTEK